MNKRTTYEIIIAKKAEQCPLPDMADDIWASVKTQLHQQAESNDNNDSGNTTQPKPPNGFTGLRMLLHIITASTIVVIVSVVMWVNRDKNKPAPTPSKNIPPTYQPGKEKQLPDSVYIKQPTPVRRPASVKNVQPVIDSSANTAIITDSLISEPVIIILQ